MITCSLLSDRHRGSGEIIFPKRWGQTKLRDGHLAQGTNGRVSFVIVDGSYPTYLPVAVSPSPDVSFVSGPMNVVSEVYRCAGQPPASAVRIILRDGLP